MNLIIFIFYLYLYIAVVQRDIIFINDGNEEIIDGKLLNVDRCKMLTEAIARSGLLHPQYTFSFPYERNSLIVNYIVEVIDKNNLKKIE